MSLAADQMRASLGMPPEDKPVPVETIDNDTGEIVIHSPSVLVVKDKPTAIDKTINSDIVDDYVHARNTTYTMLELTGNMLAGAAKVAAETEHPRAYGVFNELANTMRSLTQDLLALQKNFKDIKKDDKVLDAPGGTTIIESQTNNIINGNTSEILRVVEQNSKKPKTLDIGDADDIQDVEAKEPSGNQG